MATTTGGGIQRFMQRSVCPPHSRHEPTCHFDAIIIGAGAAGSLLRRPRPARPPAALDRPRSETIGEKIRISGGAAATSPTSAKPGPTIFHKPASCRSALSRFTPQDLHRTGQQAPHRLSRKDACGFCDESSQQIIDMLIGVSRDRMAACSCFIRCAWDRGCA